MYKPYTSSSFSIEMKNKKDLFHKHRLTPTDQMEKWVSFTKIRVSKL